MLEIWSRFRNLLYDKKILSSFSAGTFVISIGNITWGGTGKTTFVREIAHFLLTRGFRVAIVSRGYRRITSGALLVQDGSELKCKWEECGEEAYLLAKLLPDAVIAVAENRAEGARLVDGFSPDVILLDDAFQHRKLRRDLDIVLVDASEDITALRMIPFGKLRESPDSLRRSDAIVLTHAKEANPRTLEWIKDHIDRPVFHCNYLAEEPSLFQGKKIGVFCAIGAPHHFFRLLRQNGAEVVWTKAFRDHHVFSRRELQNIRDESEKNGAEFLVTTSKDFVKLDPRWVDHFIRVVNVKLQITREPVFYDFVSERLNQSGKQPSHLT
jgi:tetraacyldisaccharide 4'-kinase